MVSLGASLQGGTRRRRRGTMSGTAPILWYIGMGVIHWEAGGAGQEYMQNQWGKAARPQPALAPPGSGTRGRCSTVRVPIKVTTISGRFEILDTFMGRHSGRCPEQPRERTTKIPKNQNRLALAVVSLNLRRPRPRWRRPRGIAPLPVRTGGQDCDVRRRGRGARPLPSHNPIVPRTEGKPPCLPRWHIALNSVFHDTPGPEKSKKKTTTTKYIQYKAWRGGLGLKRQAAPACMQRPGRSKRS